MTMLGKYQIHEQLGRGGFGTVYRAVDTTLDREVALKVLHPQLTTDPDFLERFRREARLVASLHNPNIVTIYEMAEADGRVFIAMEYLAGGSLRERLEKNGPLPYSECMQVMGQVCAGLQEAHENGLVHRDIKPGNILFDKKGRAVLGDFGLARAVHLSNVSTGSSAGTVGTPAYRAPELWRGKPPASPATDVYSLGCVLFEMLTGKVLFDGETPDEVITQHLVEPPELPETFNQGAPAGLHGMLEKALEKDPTQRYLNAAEFARAMKEMIASPLAGPSPVDADETAERKSTSAPKPEDGGRQGRSTPPVKPEDEQLPAPPPPTPVEPKKMDPFWKSGKFLSVSAAVLVLVIGLVWISSIPKGESVETTPVVVTLSIPSVTVQQAVLTDTGPEIGIVLPTEDSSRWMMDETRFKKALQDSGLRAEILFSQDNNAIQRVNVDTLISRGIKVLILCPVDGDAAGGAVEAAKQAGVRVIAYDRPINGTSGVDFYITFDPVMIGKLQAEFLVENARGVDQPLYLYTGEPLDINSFRFFEGAWSVLQPKIADGTFVVANSSVAAALKDKAALTMDEQTSIINQVTTHWDPSTAGSLSRSNLAVAPSRFKGNVYVLAPNDGTALAISDVFLADPAVTGLWITGQDATKESIQYILDGKQSMTVFKDVRILVQDAVTAAKAYINGGAPQYAGTTNNGVEDIPSSTSEVLTVTRANVRSVLIDSGYYQASDFTGLP